MVNRPRILVLGCGSKRIRGAVHVDYRATCSPDYAHDLNVYPWRFVEAGTVDLILAEHILEHAKDRIRFLFECRRLCKSGGKLIVEVPHWKHHYAHAHMEHRWTFAHNSFDAVDTLDIPWRCKRKWARLPFGIWTGGNHVVNALCKWTALVSGLRFELEAL